ncbi:hypothetical protein KDA_30640 [Dictyobacter alpinus]|uniref:HTH cro/C1-type domain-containing protein n=1 Tax=Dictyobacter alpinus TaxID=2014873 RepID=A0A402B8F8_9CHLR|nr:NB-ARC domain-containing protein [Dictyobacter alpinus]GCE27580.1 hypothetical protein KDA_30640 [Dictyobacter alpinus]
MKQSENFSTRLRQEREQRGWSQEVLAERLKTNAKTISRWEQGRNRPQPYQRQALSQLFAMDVEELGLVDEAASVSIFEYQDWGDAPRGGNFYGRAHQLYLLEQAIVDRQCKVVTILGLGGIGKTSLCTKVADKLGGSFDYVFWRSLQNAPTIDQFMRQCIRFLTQEQYITVPESFDEQQQLLLRFLRHSRCLLILDNVESIIEEGHLNSQYRQGFSAYGRLIQRIGETQHQSCLLLTSREQPREIALLEGGAFPVYKLHLSGIASDEGQELLKEKKLVGTQEDWHQLTDFYNGNPLALKLVSDTIREIFGGDIALFLASGEFSFGYVEDLIAVQFERLTHQECCILYWLAVEREPVSLETICDDIVPTVTRKDVISALDSLRRRNFIELRSTAKFTLQPVIMEYVTTHLIDAFCIAFTAESSEMWKNYVLLKAQSKDFIRVSQEHLIFNPLIERLLSLFGKKQVRQRLLSMVMLQRSEAPLQRNYLANNVLRVLAYLQDDLRDIDFSYLAFKQTYFQDILLHYTNFSHAHFTSSIFKSTFSNILCIAYNPLDDTFAMGTATGEVWIYDALNCVALSQYTGHTDGVWSVAYSSDGSVLASSSDDQSIRLWNISTGRCICVLHGHMNRVRSVAFSPDQRYLVSGSDDRTVKLWDVDTRECIATFQGHRDRVWSVAYSPEGQSIVTGSTDGTICVWDVKSRKCVTTLVGHTGWVRSVAYSHNGKFLVSGSDDQTVRVWSVKDGSCLHTLVGHRNRVWSVAFHVADQMLISSSEDHCICLWDMNSGMCLRTLHAHTSGIRAIAISSDGNLLVSGGDDQTIRIWNMYSGVCLKTLTGYANRVWSVAFHPEMQMFISSSEDQRLRVWRMVTDNTVPETMDIKQGNVHGARSVVFSPDGKLYASAGEDQTVRLWNTDSNSCAHIFRGHTNWIRSVSFSPDGQFIVSGGEDNTVKVWSIQTKQCIFSFAEHTSWVRTVAFSPSGNVVASGSDDSTIRLWDLKTGSCKWIFQAHSGRVRSLVFSPDNKILASCGEDQRIYLWDLTQGRLLADLDGHRSWIRALSFNVSGALLASAGDDKDIFLWDVATRACLKKLHGHSARVRTISFHQHLPLLLSGSDDGTIRLWNTETVECENIYACEKPYEGINISGVTGLTDAQKASLLQLGAIE